MSFEQGPNRFLLKSFRDQLVGLTTENEENFVLSMNLSSRDGSPRPFMEFLIQLYRLFQVNPVSLSEGNIEIIIKADELQKILQNFLDEGQVKQSDIDQVRIFIQEDQVYFQRVNEINPEYEIAYSFPLSSLSTNGVFSMLVGLDVLGEEPNPVDVVVESTTLLVLLEMLGQSSRRSAV